MRLYKPKDGENRGPKKLGVLRYAPYTAGEMIWQISLRLVNESSLSGLYFPHHWAYISAFMRFLLDAQLFRASIFHVHAHFGRPTYFDRPSSILLELVGLN